MALVGEDKRAEFLIRSTDVERIGSDRNAGLPNNQVGHIRMSDNRSNVGGGHSIQHTNTGHVITPTHTHSPPRLQSIYPAMTHSLL